MNILPAGGAPAAAAAGGALSNMFPASGGATAAAAGGALSNILPTGGGAAAAGGALANILPAEAPAADAEPLPGGSMLWRGGAAGCCCWANMLPRLWLRAGSAGGTSNMFCFCVGEPVAYIEDGLRCGVVGSCGARGAATGAGAGPPNILSAAGAKTF